MSKQGDDNRLLETVFDMSYTAGFYGYTSEDSRNDFARILSWAEEFEATFDNDNQDYLIEVDIFVMEKIHKAGWIQREKE